MVSDIHRNMLKDRGGTDDRHRVVSTPLITEQTLTAVQAKIMSVPPFANGSRI